MVSSDEEEDDGEGKGEGVVLIRSPSSWLVRGGVFMFEPTARRKAGRGDGSPVGPLATGFVGEVPVGDAARCRSLLLLLPPLLLLMRGRTGDAAGAIGGVAPHVLAIVPPCSDARKVVVLGTCGKRFLRLGWDASNSRRRWQAEVDVV